MKKKQQPKYGIKLTQPLNGPDSVPSYAFTVVRTVNGRPMSKPGQKSYEKNSRLFQSSNDYVSLAQHFGWERTDEDASEAEAFDYLAGNVGKVVDDPGYF